MDLFRWLFVLSAFLGLNSTNQEGSNEVCDKDGCFSSPTKTVSKSPFVRCQKEIGKKGITSLSGMVGMGWDNLQNLPMAQVLNINFSNCLTTPDGEFLIPDNMEAFPIKKIKIDKMASFHGSFSEYMQSNAETINIEASGSTPKIGASASFSASHQFTKEQFSSSSTSMLVTTIDYLAYKLLVQSATDLHPAFKKRLRTIHEALSSNHDARARYLAELVIRDFGTHLVTSADVGARMQQEDFISLNDTEKSSGTLLSMRAAASASFLSVAKVEVSASAELKESEKTRFTSKLTHSRIERKGGLNVNRLLKASGTAEQPNLEMEELVVTDRAGVALHTLINEDTMPELDYFSAQRVSQQIREATNTYYHVNEIKGCMNPSAPNFDYRANVEGGCDTAKGRAYNQTFGGIYQTCEEKREPGPRPDVTGKGCSEFERKNNLTDGFKCGEYYEPVLILDTIYDYMGKTRDGFAETVKKWKLIVKTYYCRAKGAVPRQSGYMYGGFFAKNENNLFTGSSSCPQYYTAQPIFRDSVICLSRNFALAAAGEVNVAHFFSCQASGANMGCPEGYTQQTATVENKCDIMSCVRPQAFVRQMPALIKRPPFEEPSSSQTNETTDMIYFYFKNGTFWHKHELPEFLKNMTQDLMNGTSTKWNGTLNAELIIDEEELFRFVKNEYIPRELEKLERSNQPVSWQWLLGITVGASILSVTGLATIIIIIKKIASKRGKYDMNK